ncbi:Exocyst complex component S5 [Sorochytrium milnesiophthora]
MARYKLDDLMPNFWTDADDEPDETENASTARSKPVVAVTAPSSQPMDDVDPLGVKRSIIDGLPNRLQESSIKVSSKAFNPRTFLTAVHSDTTISDIQRGMQRLRTASERKSEIVRTLVNEHFDQFVIAKTTIDDVHSAMKAEHLKPDTAYETEAFADTLDIATTTVAQIYVPILDRRAQAEKVKSTLVLLERFKFFFNLPNSLLDSIQKNKFEAAVRDFKKGKNLIRSMYPDIGAGDAPPKSPTSPSSEVAPSSQQRRLFEKVWSEAEKIAASLKDRLFRQLCEHEQPMDAQETAISHLLELDPGSDPVWFYLDSRYKWITASLREKLGEYAKAGDAIRDAFAARASQPGGGGSSADWSHRLLTKTQLRNAIHARTSKEFEMACAFSYDQHVWKCAAQSIKVLCSMLTLTLPDFWKIAKAYIDGKYDKKGPASPVEQRRQNRLRTPGFDFSKIGQCEKMTKQIIDQFALILAHILDMPVQPMQLLINTQMPSPNPGGENNRMTMAFGPGSAVPALIGALPPVIPLPAVNSTTIAQYICKIVHETVSCYNDVKGFKISGDAVAMLAEASERIKSRLLDTLCDAWLSDSKRFHRFEDWQSDADRPEMTSALHLFSAYERFMVKSAFKISNSAISLPTDEQDTPLQMYTDKITPVFWQTLYNFMDGLHTLTFAEVAGGKPLQQAPATSATSAPSENLSTVDHRILITLSNIAYLKSTALPGIVRVVEESSGSKLGAEIKRMDDAVERLDKVIFDDYIKRYSRQIDSVIQRGILQNGINWFTISKPSEVQAWVHDTLMILVHVHAQVLSVASIGLLVRILTQLSNNLAQSLLDTFRKVDRFGLGGILQATLEVEFIHQTLAVYESPVSIDLFQMTYSAITKGWVPEGDPAVAKQKLQDNLGLVKEILIKSRKATAVQFMCFSKDAK